MAAPVSCGETEGQTTAANLSSTALAPYRSEQGYLVHTPPCYDVDVDRRYPVIWLLHGANADESQWAAVGVAAAADRLIADGQIPPVILVLPDGLDAMAAYDGDPPPFDTFLLDELRPRVDDQYRTLTDREHTAIGGISRGGEWALLVAGRHPDVFSEVGGHSPAVGEVGGTNEILVPLLAGTDLRIRLDVGRDDALEPAVAELDAALTTAGVDHEFEQAEGGHDRAYWGSQLEQYLRWYAGAW